MRCEADMNIFWSGNILLVNIWSDAFIHCVDGYGYEPPVDCALFQVAVPAAPFLTAGHATFENPCIAVTNPKALGYSPTSVCIFATVADPGQQAWGATPLSCTVV